MIHDSNLCACSMCRWVGEQSSRLNEAEFIALATPVLERARVDLNDGEKLTERLDPARAQRILAAMENDKKFASLTTIRAAIMDVIDAGCRHSDSLTHEWRFDNADEDFANEQRCNFVDAVCQRIAELQCAPYNFDPQFYDYSTGYATGWADAHTETLREQNTDLKELLRTRKVGTE